MANKGFTMKVKTGNGYVNLYPQTLLSQIENVDIGEVYKVEIVLSADGWNEDYQQTVAVNDILESDTPMITKILEGTEEQIKAQANAYNLINPIIGVYSSDGNVKFTCSDKPQVDFKVQVYWTR